MGCSPVSRTGQFETKANLILFMHFPTLSIYNWYDETRQSDTQPTFIHTSSKMKRDTKLIAVALRVIKRAIDVTVCGTVALMH